MSSPQKKSISVAPLKIVALYEEFKDALRIGDIAHAKKVLQEMRKYQGGEKLANELVGDLKALQEELGDVEPEKEDEAAKNEQAAQNVLAHLEIFETHLHDKQFDLAAKEIEVLEIFEDKKLIQNLSKKLIQERKKYEQAKQSEKQETYDHSLHAEESQEVSESLRKYREILTIAEVSKADAKKQYLDIYDQLLPPEHEKAERYFADYDAEIKEEVYQSLRDERLTYASNLLKKYPFSEEDIVVLEKAIEEMKSQKKEKQRRMKRETLQDELESALFKKDFKLAKKTLTKLKRVAKAAEYEKAEKLMNSALESDSKALAEKLSEAIIEHIESKNFDLARKNLEDYKKIAKADGKNLESLLELSEQQIKQQEAETLPQALGSKQKVQELFEQAQELLSQRNFKELKVCIDEMKVHGDVHVAEYLQLQLNQLQGQEAKRSNALRRQEWKMLFEEQKGKNNVSALKVLLQDARDIFEPGEIDSYQNIYENIVHESEVERFLKKDNFEKAREYVHKKVHLTAQKESLIKNIQMAEDHFNETSYQEEKEYLEMKIEAAKNKGDVKELQNLQTLLLELEQKQAYRDVQTSLAEKKALFDNYAQEALYEYVLQQYLLGNTKVAETKKQELSSERKEKLEHDLQEQKQLKEDALITKECKRLESELLQAQRIKDVTKQELLIEQIEKIAPERNVEDYKKHLEQDREIQREDQVAEKIQAAERYFYNGDREKVKILAQQLYALGAKERAQSLLQRAIQEDRKHEDELIKEHVKVVLNQLKNFYDDQDCESYYQLLKQEGENFLSFLEMSQKKTLQSHLEELVVLALEKHHFSLAKKLLAQYESFGGKYSNNLSKIIQERMYFSEHPISAEPILAEIARKHAIIKNYELWKQEHQAGADGVIYVQNIEQMGESGLAKILSTFVVASKATEKNYLYEDSKSLLEKHIQEVFPEKSFSYLQEILTHYQDVWNHEQKKEQESSVQKFEKNLMACLDQKDFSQARKLFSLKNLEQITKSEALRLLEQVEYHEQSAKKSELEAFERSVFAAIEKKDWDTAKKLCANYNGDTKQYLEDILKRETEALLQAMKDYWLEQKNVIASFLESGDIASVWKIFENLEAQTPFEIFETERKELIEDISKAIEEYHKQAKLSLYELLEADNTHEAQKQMASYDRFSRKYKESIEMFFAQEERFNEVVLAVKNALAEDNKDTAKMLFVAARKNLSSRQQAYIEYLIDNAREQEVIKEELEQENADEVFRQAFLAALEADDYDIKDLQNFSGDRAVFIACFYAYQEKKHKHIWQDFEKQALKLLHNIEEGEVNEELLQGLEDRFLDICFHSGEHIGLIFLQHIFEAIQKHAELCEQEEFSLALKNKDVTQANSIVQKRKYLRIKSVFDSEIKILQEQESKKAKDKNFAALQKNIQDHSFKLARRKIRDVKQWSSYEAIEQSYIELLKQEINEQVQNKNNFIDLLVNYAQQCIQMGDTEQFKAIEPVLEAILPKDVYKDLTKYSVSVSVSRKEELQEERRQSTKAIQKFVLQAKKSYNFEENENSLELLESILTKEEEKAKEEDRRKLCIQRAEDAFVSRDIQEAKDMIAELQDYPSDVKRLEKELKRVQEIYIKELIAEKRYQEAEIILNAM